MQSPKCTSLPFHQAPMGSSRNPGTGICRGSTQSTGPCRRCSSGWTPTTERRSDPRRTTSRWPQHRRHPGETRGAQVGVSLPPLLLACSGWDRGRGPSFIHRLCVCCAKCSWCCRCTEDKGTRVRGYSFRNRRALPLPRSRLFKRLRHLSMLFRCTPARLRNTSSHLCLRNFHGGCQCLRRSRWSLTSRVLFIARVYHVSFTDRCR